MRIKQFRAYLKHLPLSKPYTIAYKTIFDTEIVFLEIELENGLRGIGAANPFEEVVGETPENAYHQLSSGLLDQWVGRDIRHFQAIIDESAKQLVPNPGAQAAIDIALHDLFCKYLDIPLVDFYGRKIGALPTSVTIGIKPVEEALEEARGYFKLGFRAIKLKTGLDVDQDIELVAKLREQFGRSFQLRVDANQGYDLVQLRKFLHATNSFEVELMEQPLPVGSEDALRSLPAGEQRRLCADESLLDTHAAIKLSLEPQPYGIFNIKLMKCGGIKSAREIAAVAGHTGIELFWGCNDESIVSIAAALHAAYSCPNTRYLDLDGSFDVVKDLVEGGFELKNGKMEVVSKAGLGVVFSE
ncbi:MAG: dipeptide epimerase [Saprospiraceae bacterium]|nr:dipeptide epimerase [Saprospiraceae bacterium]